jgi:PhzF family phenazine biosynthesis protein
MKKQTVVLVDAFTDRAFSGNQAAVCFFKTRGKFTVEQMQLIAAELNLSETCFVFPVEENLFSLRWFTPTVEVPLCGHATLAAAHVIFEKQKTAPKSQVKHKVVRFQTQTKGELVVRKDDKRKGFMMMDFPVGKPEQQKVTEPILEALQKALSLAPGAITELWQCNFTRKLLVIVNSPDAVKGTVFFSS